MFAASFALGRVAPQLAREGQHLEARQFGGEGGIFGEVGGAQEGFRILGWNAKQEGLAGGWAQQSSQVSQEGRFARTVGPQKPQDLASFQAQIQVLEDWLAPQSKASGQARMQAQ